MDFAWCGWRVGCERREVRHGVPARCSLRAVVARHHVAGSLMVLRHGYGGTVADIGVQFVVDAMGC